MLILGAGLGCGGAKPEAAAGNEAPEAAQREAGQTPTKADAQGEQADAPGDAELDGALAKSRELSGALGKQLKAKLMAALSADGPATAIEVCQLEAPKIATELSADGWQVGRTAARVRNPDNAANEWQARGLAALEPGFAAVAGDPEAMAKVEWHEVVDGEGGRELHYMRAIPMGAPCLGCHGARDSLLPEVREQLDARYPEDEATGFAAGDLRGAFVVSVQL
ncbi:DUF3365 domain-containing protein [Pseudenhygromyxa sp. WMMC2535]|uniref:Tll0287-like domain-containing protein n=1 Tax=Pseudenhygromyxa sp. WMMC2535 TaxID=2712867 RepID=UPI001556D980|nr:DUF3365 domain-containing protein [Pseudenhygromyxa sp. WMMC2535]NVB41395.1 DUF3365 domain-containing protein [Pseudenhygromyxa sp. WMMC2535]